MFSTRRAGGIWIRLGKNPDKIQMGGLVVHGHMYIMKWDTIRKNPFTMRNEVVLHPYTEDWVTQYKAEAKKIKKALGSNVVSIHHMGSTAIPGMIAKPIVDILVVVDRLRFINVPGLEALGYSSQLVSNFSIPLHRFFQRQGFHLHIFETGNAAVDMHLMFKKFLLAHPDARQEYQSLKQQLADRFPLDRKQYTKGKNAWVKAALRSMGCKGASLAFPFHDEEWEAYRSLMPHEDPQTTHRLLLYVGADILGAANFFLPELEKDAYLQSLVVREPSAEPAFRTLLERWTRFQGKEIKS